MTEDQPFKLISSAEERPGWVTYTLRGSNGATIAGGRAGMLEEVRAELQIQLAKANKRRLSRQQWIYWNWNYGGKPEAA